MVEVDLIPSDYRAALRVSKWLRLFGFALAAALSALGFAYGVLDYDIGQRKAQIARLEARKAVTAQQRTVLDALQARKTELTKRLNQLTALRGGLAAQRMFRVVDRAMDGRDIWFSTWQFQRSGVAEENEPGGSGTSHPGTKNRRVLRADAKDWSNQTHMKIHGQALDHGILSRFVRRLLAEPEIRGVRILKTALRKYTSHRVVDFQLIARMNDNAAGER